ncbi:hypothetical protein [Brevibacillus sp. HB2.2]|uniref:hypothetical protein n=1 Tax=Brevibacillus sp. HB2.2 TaxID=2738846 RepID=UPI00156AC4A7|nr:hypothetical protein [Brevibacillus sp. HB2.2]NRS52068.1 hypothetical protein [Brevibacillus sp. HB2.2]
MNENPMFISNNTNEIIEKINEYLFPFVKLAEDFPHLKELVPNFEKIQWNDPNVVKLLLTIRDTPEILNKVTLVRGFVGDALHILARPDHMTVMHDNPEYLKIDAQSPEGLIFICQKFDSINLYLDERRTDMVIAEMEAFGPKY